jgi:sporulation protein YlmC with PRC-barrel domain
MNKMFLLTGAAVLGLSLLSGAATAQVVNSSRGSEIIGANVLNNSGVSIGKVDDLIITQDGKAPQAVLSVGGFLGVGARLVAVPYDSFKISIDSKVTYPNATKENLAALPEFQYPKKTAP